MCLDSEADPNPDFDFNVEPDSAFPSEADPVPQHCLFCINLPFKDRIRKLATYIQYPDSYRYFFANFLKRKNI
jgi:hypothetical protein